MMKLADVDDATRDAAAASPEAAEAFIRETEARLRTALLTEL
jgi:hypothetical protein